MQDSEGTVGVGSGSAVLLTIYKGAGLFFLFCPVTDVALALRIQGLDFGV